MARPKQSLITTLNAQTTVGAGVALDVTSYKTVVFQIFTTGSANATIKFGVSYSLEQPNFNISPSATNVYDYITINQLNNATQIIGTAGIVITGTDIVQLYEVNSNYVKWICPIVTAISSGSVTVQSDAVDNYARG